MKIRQRERRTDQMIELRRRSELHDTLIEALERIARGDGRAKVIARAALNEVANSD